MNIKLLNKIALFLFLVIPMVHAEEDQTDIIVYPQENSEAPTDPNVKQTVDTINDNFRRTSRRLRAIENGIPFTNITGIATVAQGGTGQDFSAGTAGDLLYFSSLGVIGHAPITNFLSNVGHIRIYTSSDTFVAPAGVNNVLITMIGGGGGGGGMTSSINGGAGGGGAGAYVIGYPYKVTPLSSYTVTVGLGGAGGSSSGVNGSTGGTTTFDIFSVLGGGGGISGIGGNGGSGGAAVSSNASASISTTGTTGGPRGNTGVGGNGAKGDNGSTATGAGGGSPFGVGANGITGADSAGTNGSANTGAGGSGAIALTSPGGTNFSGGNGGSGIVIVQY